jgi:glutathione S-transferase
MVPMPHYTAVVTLLAVAFYFFLATGVAAAHDKFGIQLPAMTGNPDFERIKKLRRTDRTKFSTCFSPW